MDLGGIKKFAEAQKALPQSCGHSNLSSASDLTTTEDPRNWFGQSLWLPYRNGNKRIKAQPFNEMNSLQASKHRFELQNHETHLSMQSSTV